MSIKRKIYNTEFKTKLVLKVLYGKKTLNEVASQYEILSKNLLNWKKQYLEKIFSEYRYDRISKERKKEIEQLLLNINLDNNISCVLKSIQFYKASNTFKINFLEKLFNYLRNHNRIIDFYNLIKSRYIGNKVYAIYILKIFNYYRENNYIYEFFINMPDIIGQSTNNYIPYLNKLFKNELNIKDKEFLTFYQKWFKNENFLYLDSDLEYMKEVRRRLLWSSSKYEYYNIQDKLIKIIKKPDIFDAVLILSFEAKYILKDYQNIDFEDYPECEESIQNLTKKVMRMGNNFSSLINFKKFINGIEKLLKDKKIILSLYILTNYGGWNTKGEAKLIVDVYIQAFVLLNRYDILAKYYNKLNIMSCNIEFLEQITSYFIKNKKTEKAYESIQKMKLLEPSYGYINEAQKQFDSMLLVDKMISMNIDIEKINRLSGQEFEKLLISQFLKLGYKTKDTPITGDYGADIIIETNNETKIIIQCKRFKSRVNLKAVQEVAGALAYFNGDIGIVITNSTFLNSAIKLAKSNDIELWGKNELMLFLLGDVSFSQINEL